MGSAAVAGAAMAGAEVAGAAVAGAAMAGAEEGSEIGQRADARGIERLFEMTSDLLATISLDGRFTLLNPAWEQRARLDRARSCMAEPIAGVRAPGRRRADARADAAPARDRSASSRTSPTATATATARGAGCCGARAATATPGTPRPRT